MILRITSLAICLFLLQLVTNAQHVPAADEVLKNAFTQAAKENKNVFIIFHASWCGWCHRMDSSMNDKSCKAYFDKSYVIRHLTVLESADKKQLENPGAMQLLEKYKGADQGIPFWLVFDKNGTLLADSQIRPGGAGLETKGANCGCPAQPEEVAYFISVLKKTSSITASEILAIEKRFRENAQ
jgi:thioredoxin-related protein